MPAKSALVVALALLSLAACGPSVLTAAAPGPAGDGDADRAEAADLPPLDGDAEAAEPEETEATEEEAPEGEAEPEAEEPEASEEEAPEGEADAPEAADDAEAEAEPGDPEPEASEEEAPEGEAEPEEPEAEETEATEEEAPEGEAEPEEAPEAEPTPGFALLPAGAFWMGSPDGACPVGYPGDCAPEAARQPDEALHYVRLAVPFEVGLREVTRAEYAAALGEHPSSTTCGAAACPVETVSWHGAARYANAASAAAGLPACYACATDGTCAPAAEYARPQDCPGYRLPTEAEWEYATRAGSHVAYYPAPGTAGTPEPLAAPPCDAALDHLGWFHGNSGAVLYCGGWLNGNAPHPGGEKAANASGLYDLLGNVAEWTGDWYAEAYPAGTPDAPAVDPAGPAAGSRRVLRGGHWADLPGGCRAARRLPWLPGSALDRHGFRLARSRPDAL